jgi:hypothetical protein
MVGKDAMYRGLYLIGDKQACRITDVQVIDLDGTDISLSLAGYVGRSVEPPYETLPWREDLIFKPAALKGWEPSRQ